jgi:eukaryotic-like serine/threonine-protein kinase
MRIPTRYNQIYPPVPGGFGNTILCVDKHLDRKIIVKQINDPMEKDRLFDEIEALQKAKSKHVVEIYDVIVSHDDDEIAIVEEFLPGNDLVGFLADSNRIGELISILYQLSCGLRDIHDCGIVHRDFKTNNVKFDAEGIIKIFDFGLAKHESLPASTTGIIGTYGYMAPELCRRPPIIDKPVDCYAFGATAFELVTGSTPRCAQKKPIPRALRPNEGILNHLNLNDRIATLIDSCLAIDPNDRPKMKDIANSLEKELLQGRHKATIWSGGEVHFLDELGKGVRIARGQTDSLKIAYDGYEFVIREVAGDIYVNGVAVGAGHVLEGSCVIILGHPDEQAARKFVTFDISHPEVIV